MVNVVVNNRLPLNFLFDTGSKHTILTDEKLIPLLGQLPTERIKIVGSDLGIPASGFIMRRTSLVVGDISLENQSLILLDDGILDLNLLSEEPIHGILGIGSFGAYGLKIDYQARAIELIGSKDIKPYKKGTVIPIRVEQSKAYVDVVANFHSGKTQALSLLLDTGASLSLIVHADSTLFPPKVVSGSFGFGLGGVLLGYVGRSDNIKIGPFNLPDIITHFQTLSVEKDSLVDHLPVRQGIIGNGILDRFELTIDFSNKELHLRQTRKSTRPKPFDRSGIRLVKDGQKLNKLRVQHIVKDSPAHQAGIKVGDQLLKVGVLKVPFRSLPSVEKIFRGRIGRRVRVTLERNREQYTRKITLRNLI